MEGSLGEERNEHEAKTEYMCLNGGPPGSVKMQSEQLSQVTEFYMESTLQSDECRREQDDSL